jgi:hypothetical protein
VISEIGIGLGGCEESGELAEELGRGEGGKGFGNAFALPAIERDERGFERLGKGAVDSIAAANAPLCGNYRRVIAQGAVNGDDQQVGQPPQFDNGRDGQRGVFGAAAERRGDFGQGDGGDEEGSVAVRQDIEEISDVPVRRLSGDNPGGEHAGIDHADWGGHGCLAALL